MKARHLFPTAPDTLRSFPFVNEDPFVITESPHIYFAGNQPKFETSIIQKEGSVTRLICIPSFRRSKSIVLIDLTSLQAHEFKFDAGELMNMHASEELEFQPQSNAT